MGLILESDLVYTYSWTAIKGDDPRISGEPDSTMFSRNEGYEVLYLINKLAELWKFKQKASGLKIERMIKNDLPSNTRSQENVKNWIHTNFAEYKK